MEEIKYMVIYLDNSCEVHFNSAENSRIILSPCGTEFIYRVYGSDNSIQSTNKYRTAYPLSMFTTKLSTILRIRNRFCDDRPFISPILLENSDKSFWMSSEDLVEAKWDIREMSLNSKNPIEIDYHNYFYVWKSMCKNVELKLHFNKKIFSVKYPVKVPKSLNDEFEQKCDINNTICKLKMRNQNFVSKHLFKYTFNEQEFAVNHLPFNWEELYFKMVELIDKSNTSSNSSSSSDTSLNDSIKEYLTIKLPEAIPLSCQSTHLHRFDGIETLSEPKVIYLNQTWYKLFYKNKTIEISCPITQNEITFKQSNEDTSNDISRNIDLESTQDYLVSDTQSGKFYSCFSLKRRSGDVEEIKICVENIPSFKLYIQKTLSYANILLKRINTIKYISNYSSCYINKKIEEIEPTVNKIKTGLPVISIEELKNNSSNNTKSSSIIETTLNSLESVKTNIKNQFYIKDIGHFKYMKNNTILINFIDKVKLYVDENSIRMLLKKDRNKCFCSIYLPDNSEHEICLGDSSSTNGFFEKYINFLDQWLNWLLENRAIKNHDYEEQNSNELYKNEYPEIVNFNSMQSHLSRLKLFNYSIEQNSYINDMVNFPKESHLTKNMSSNEPLISVNNLLRENSEFLKNISK